MKAFNTFYENYDQLSQFVKVNRISDYDNVLVQVFLGRVEFEFANSLIKELKDILPKAYIIGTTTAGEILNCEIFSGTTVLSFSVFYKTTLKTAIVDNYESDFALGENLAKNLVSKNTKLLIAFGNAFSINGSNMLAGIESVGNTFKVAGGHAGNNGRLNGTFVFTEKGIADKGAAGVSLNSDGLTVFNEYSLSWQEIGKIMIVTKSSNNKVYEIDNMNVMDVYRKYLGDKVVNSLPQSATEFPLIISKDGMKIARCPLAVYDDGSLGFIGNVEEGSKVSFSYGNVDMLVNRSAQLVELLSKRGLESIFVYSCTARRVFMQERIQDELIPLKDFAAVSGFFTYGEYYQTSNKRNVLLNITTTLLGLSEKDKGKKHRNLKHNSICHIGSRFHKDNFVKGKKEIIIEVLNNLVNAVTGELEEKNKDLEKKNFELSKANNELENYARIIQENQNILIENEKVASLGHLTAGIAHNLKTPIMAISGEAVILKDRIGDLMRLSEKLPNAQEFKDVMDNMEYWLQCIRSNLSYISEVISAVKGHILNLDNQSQGEFTINELIKKINILMGHELKKNKCSLKIDIQADAGMSVLGNINDLVQVLNVLISNAIDSYLGNGGIIELVVAENNSVLKIMVRDRGIGVNKKTSDKIFKEMVTTKGKRGSGLGLYIANSIIKGRFKGDINFKSLLGQGSTFLVTIPIK